MVGHTLLFSSRCYASLKIELLPVKGELIEERPRERQGGEQEPDVWSVALCKERSFCKDGVCFSNQHGETCGKEAAGL